MLILYAADATDLAPAVASAAGVRLVPGDGPGASDATDPGAGLPTVAVLGREAGPARPDGSAVPRYRDASGEFARIYHPDGGTGFVVRPDGQLGARFPLAGTAAALSAYFAGLSAPG